MKPDRWLLQIMDRADPDGWLAFIVCTGRRLSAADDQGSHTEEVVGVLFDHVGGGLHWGPRTIYLNEEGTHARVLIHSTHLSEDETTSPEEAEKIRDLMWQGSVNVECPLGCHWRIPEERWEGSWAKLAAQPSAHRPDKVNVEDVALRRGATGN